MPAPVIAALGGQLASAAIGMGAQSVANAQQNRQNINYYNMQRADALIDKRIDNEYNSPAAQMNRLKIAGISPHAASGQSILSASASQPTRGTQMANAPAAYQVNNATNAMQMKLGLEQLRNMQLQAEKTIAETESVRADTDNKRLEYGANSSLWDGSSLKVLDKKRMLEVDEAMSRINTQNQQSQKTAYETEHVKESTRGLRTSNELLEMRKAFENQMLSGNATLLKSRIAGLDLDNYRKKQENVYVPQIARLHAQKLGYDTELTRQQAQMLDTLPPSVRYVIERIGGPAMIATILKMLTK